MREVHSQYKASGVHYAVWGANKGPLSWHLFGKMCPDVKTAVWNLYVTHAIYPLQHFREFSLYFL